MGHTHLLDLLGGNGLVLGVYGSLRHNDDIQSFFPGTVLGETENEHPQTPKLFKQQTNPGPFAPGEWPLAG